MVLLPGQAQGYGAHGALRPLWTVDGVGGEVRAGSSLEEREQREQISTARPSQAAVKKKS